MVDRGKWVTPLDLERILERWGHLERQTTFSDLWPRLSPLLEPLPALGETLIQGRSNPVSAARRFPQWLETPGLQVAVSMAASLALVYGMNYAPNPTPPTELARYIFDAVAWVWAAPAWMFSTWAGVFEVLASFF